MSKRETKPMNNPAISVPDRSNILALPLITFLLVGAAFFVIEHDIHSQELYRDLVGSDSIDDLQRTGEMFEQRGMRQAGGLALAAAGGFFLLIFNRRATRGLSLLGLMILFFVAWNGLSLLWADDMALTFRRLVFFAFLCIGAAGIAVRWSMRDVLVFTALCTSTFIAVGVGVEMYNGTFDFRDNIYRFAGSLHPNAQAVNCSLLIFSALALRYETERGRLFLWVLVGVGFAFLYLTKSRTALASTAAVLLLFWGLTQATDRKVLAGAIVAAGFAFLMLLSSVFLPMIQEGIRLGREEQDRESIGTLTGRTELWSQLNEFIAARPVLGYGYGGFWNEQRSWEVMEEQGWPISHAHNAYIDIMLDAGPIAALLYVLILIVGLRYGHLYFRASRQGGYAFMVLLLLFCALNGFLESIAIQRSLVTFLSFVLIVKLGFAAPPREYEAEVLQTEANRRALTSPVPANPAFAPRSGSPS